MGKKPKKHSEELKFKAVTETLQIGSVSEVARNAVLMPNLLTELAKAVFWRRELRYSPTERRKKASREYRLET